MGEATGEAVLPPEPAQPRPEALNFLDLPPETQQEIIAHCSTGDLICVALVNKRFHELASAVLYRYFHIIFPDDDDAEMESPIDGLASGLDTFTTSSYDYAKHLRDLSLDTLSAGLKGELSYQPFLYSASCGKFLNTLLHLTLRKARSLESFRWNVRIELSRPVYRELHHIRSLRNLHIRLQAGRSYYNTPPPLPINTPSTPPPPLQPVQDLFGPFSPIDLNAPVNFLDHHNPITGSPPPPPPPVTLAPYKPLRRKHDRPTAVCEPLTIGGFKNLKSLAVLEIDSLNLVPELKTCLNNSPQLEELQLSLSDSLAAQSRKPPPESDPEDSDLEDEFAAANGGASHNSSLNNFGPAMAYRAQEERKAQEALLGKILDVEHTLNKKGRLPDRRDEPVEEEEAVSTDHVKDPHEAFINSLKAVSQKLMGLTSGSRELTSSHQESLDQIEKAARKYVQTVVSTDVKGFEKAPDPVNDISSSSRDSSIDEDDLGGPVADGISGEEEAGDSDSTTAGERQAGAPGLKANRDSISEMEEASTAASENDMNQEETMMSSPTDTKTIGPPLRSSSSGRTRETTSRQETSMAPANGNQTEQVHSLLRKLSVLENQAQGLESAMEGLQRGGANVNISASRMRRNSFHNAATQLSQLRQDIKRVKAEMQAASSSVLPEEAEGDHKTYARGTRGLELKKLALHLIPVKATVLQRAIHLPALRNLTLLNVGNQIPIWTMLSKENRIEPLALRSVHTDHVSVAFLNCIAQLEEIHDLFMYEHNGKHKLENFASQSRITIDQIRKLVLRKHMPHIRRLMIKDDTIRSKWDVNSKTMVLICSQGVKVEELALSMNIRALHAFMQHLSNLRNLRALSILHFRNNDTCIWVMREVLNFIVDNLSHHPDSTLEWIATEDERVDRVIRPSENGNDGQSPDDTGVPGAPDPVDSYGDLNHNQNGHSLLGQNDPHALPSFPLDGLGSDSDSDTESYDTGSRLKLKVMGPYPFHAVWGVKIFDKEVRSGWL